MTEYYTENLADFGFREIKMLKEILDSWINNGLPREFTNEGVKPAMNKSSGHVFLVNSDYQTAMINPENDRLEIWYNLPYSGHEGFLMDLFNENNPELISSDDLDYLLSCRTDKAFDYDKLSTEWKEWIDSANQNEP